MNIHEPNCHKQTSKQGKGPHSRFQLLNVEGMRKPEKHHEDAPVMAATVKTYQWMLKLNGWKCQEKEDICSLKIFPFSYLLITKGK